METTISSLRRPILHFTPEKSWMNDPNGLIYLDGEYHLFYQFYPDGVTPGPMCWGHAVSRDLIQWDHLDIALKPDELGLIFSGSVIFDRDNVSGLFDQGKGGLIAYYTNHYENKPQNIRIECQSMAYSNDNGRTWRKYHKNPIVTNHETHNFRDPKVVYYGDGNKWIMVVAAGDRVKFYQSFNLTDWRYLSEFKIDVGGIWECPDLFEINVRDTDEKIWVFKVDLVEHDQNTTSQTVYRVGEFDGTTFLPLESQGEEWIDFGADFYAAQSWSNLPNQRNIWIAWMSNWKYATEIPADGWRGTMSFPREVWLKKKGNTYFLCQKPVEERKKYFKKEAYFRDVAITPGEKFSQDIASVNEVYLEFSSDADLIVEYSNRQGESVKIAYHPGKKALDFDRNDSGTVEFSESFPRKITKVMHGLSDKNTLSLLILKDTNSFEIFVNDGEYTMTNLVFPRHEYSTVNIGTPLKEIILKRIETKEF